MALKNSIMELPLQHSVRTVGSRIDRSVVGEPPWAVKTRVALACLEMFYAELELLLAAVRADDSVACAAAVENIGRHLTNMKQMVLGIPLPGSGDCAVNIAALRAELNAGVLPDSEMIETIAKWIDDVKC